MASANAKNGGQIQRERRKTRLDVEEWDTVNYKIYKSIKFFA